MSLTLKWEEILFKMEARVSSVILRPHRHLHEVWPFLHTLRTELELIIVALNKGDDSLTLICPFFQAVTKASDHIVQIEDVYERFYTSDCGQYGNGILSHLSIVKACLKRLGRDLEGGYNRTPPGEEVSEDYLYIFPSSHKFSVAEMRNLPKEGFRLTDRTTTFCEMMTQRAERIMRSEIKFLMASISGIEHFLFFSPSK